MPLNSSTSYSNITDLISSSPPAHDRDSASQPPPSLPIPPSHRLLHSMVETLPLPVPDRVKLYQLCLFAPAAILELLMWFDQHSSMDQHSILLALQSHQLYCFSSSSAATPGSSSTTPSSSLALSNPTFQGTALDPRKKPLRHGLPFTTETTTTSISSSSISTSFEKEKMALIKEESEPMVVVDDLQLDLDLNQDLADVNPEETLLVPIKHWPKKKQRPVVLPSTGTSSSSSSTFSWNITHYPKEIIYRIFFYLSLTPSALSALQRLNTQWYSILLEYTQAYPTFYTRFHLSNPSSDSNPLIYQSFLFTFRDVLFHPSSTITRGLFFSHPDRPIQRLSFLGEPSSPFLTNHMQTPDSMFLPLPSLPFERPFHSFFPSLTHLEVIDPFLSFPMDDVNLLIQSLAPQLQTLTLIGALTLYGEYPRLTGLHLEQGVKWQWVQVPQLQVLYMNEVDLVDVGAFYCLLQSTTLVSWTFLMESMSPSHFQTLSSSESSTLPTRLPSLQSLCLSRPWATFFFTSAICPQLTHVHLLGSSNDAVPKHASKILLVTVFTFVTHLTLSKGFEIDHHVYKLLTRSSTSLDLTTVPPPVLRLQSLMLIDIQVTPRTLQESRPWFANLGTCDLSGNAAWSFFLTFGSPKLQSLSLRNVTHWDRFSRWPKLRHLHFYQLTFPLKLFHASLASKLFTWSCFQCTFEGSFPKEVNHFPNLTHFSNRSIPSSSSSCSSFSSSSSNPNLPPGWDPRMFPRLFNKR